VLVSIPANFPFFFIAAFLAAKESGALLLAPLKNKDLARMGNGRWKAEDGMDGMGATI
jgi:hypothetical protein